MLFLFLKATPLHKVHISPIPTGPPRSPKLQHSSSPSPYIFTLCYRFQSLGSFVSSATFRMVFFITDLRPRRLRLRPDFRFSQPQGRYPVQASAMFLNELAISFSQHIYIYIHMRANGIYIYIYMYPKKYIMVLILH